MKGFKLVAAHAHSVEVRHPDGSTFHIAKTELDLPMLQKLMKLPQHFADGGTVQESDVPDDSAQQAPQQAPVNISINATPQQTTPQAAAPAPVDASQPGTPQPIPGPAGTVPVAGYTGPAVADPDPSAVPPAPTPAPAPVAAQQAPAAPAPVTSVTPSSGNPVGALNAGYSQEQKGNTAEAAALGAEGTAKATVYDTQATQLSNNMKAANDEHIALDKQNNALRDAISTQQIDPKRFMSNMSTGNKIMASIGMALSGIGSGLSGQSNFAVDAINKAIDEDIKSQQTDLGKKQTLYSDNLKRYGDVTQAQIATAAQMNAIAQGQLAAVAGRAQGPIAQAQAQKINGQLKTQQVTAQQSLVSNMLSQEFTRAQMGAKLGLANGQSGVNPELLTPEDRSRVVSLPGGRQALAPTAGDAETVKDVQSTFDQVRDGLDRLDAITKDQVPVLGGLPGTENRKKAEVVIGGLQNALKKLQDNKRLSEPVVENLMSQIPRPDTFFSLRSNNAVASQELRKTLDTIQAATLSSHLEGYTPGKKLNTTPRKPR
jgi:hypothetical protein